MFDRAGLSDFEGPPDVVVTVHKFVDSDDGFVEAALQLESSEF